MTLQRARYSLVIPVFNEEAVLPLLLRRVDHLLDSLDDTAEAIFVDDGSRDCSPIILEAKAKDDPRYRFIGLSRNFGHQIAITAGMDAACGDAVIVMDADLQDPPEVVLDLVAKWKEGFQIVYAQRVSREGESAFKRWTADAFYRLLSRVANVEIPRNVGDFRLVDRRALDAFKSMRERDRFVRGMFGWMGFRQTAVPFHRQERAAGSTKYPLWKMMRLASDGIVGFSDAPLRAALWVGVTVSLAALAYGLYVVGLWFHQRHLVEGWASTVVIVSFLCGINMLMTGIVGLYIGRIHAEVKNRPLYLVDRLTGFDRALDAQRGPMVGGFAEPSKTARRA
jgi:glycosyltransferase involved in cell wall biosynthesis